MAYEEPDTKKIVYFVRHGQSEGNVGNVFQAPDSPLNEEGKRQAERIAGRVARISFESLISSTLPRAHDTAEIIGRVVEKTPELSELFVERIKPSSIVGQLCNNKKAMAIHRAWSESLHTKGMRVEDGENFDDIIERADKALSFLGARPERTLVVVTHSFFLRALTARAVLQDTLSDKVLEEYIEGTSMMNTGLSAFRFEETPRGLRWRLWVYNDHVHLG